MKEQELRYAVMTEEQYDGSEDYNLDDIIQIKTGKDTQYGLEWFLAANRFYCDKINDLTYRTWEELNYYLSDILTRDQRNSVQRYYLTDLSYDHISIDPKPSDMPSVNLIDMLRFGSGSDPDYARALKASNPQKNDWTALDILKNDCIPAWQRLQIALWDILIPDISPLISLAAHWADQTKQQHPDAADSLDRQLQQLHDAAAHYTPAPTTHPIYGIVPNVVRDLESVHALVYGIARTAWVWANQDAEKIETQHMNELKNILEGNQLHG